MTDRSHVDNKLIDAVDAEQLIGSRLVVGGDGTGTAVDRTGGQIKVLADMAGIEQEIGRASWWVTVYIWVVAG